MFRKSDTHIHFVGIGGIGMSGIAELLLNLGYRVTGTDLGQSETTRRLQRLGAVVHRGHNRNYLGDADVVVISSAIGADNPEVIAAHTQKIPVIPRAEMLAELMRLKQGIAIAGSHGKTTTTSLIATALHHAEVDPTVVIGGKLNALGTNARLGQSDILVAEADESDGSFLLLSPTIAVITNIDAEHLDHHGDLDGLKRAFIGFANRVPFYGLAVVCIDSPNVRAVLPRLQKRFVTYGFSADADYQVHDLRHDGPSTRFCVRSRVHHAHRLAKVAELGEFVLNMPGVHNVLNAVATIAVCESQEVDTEVTRSALAAFDGVQRRFTVRGHVGGVLVVDDYGHHPTEIRATLAGARTSYASNRIVAAFQPHRYTRVRDHLEEFAESLDDADVVVLTDIHPAGEKPIPGATAERLLAAIDARKPGRSTLLVPRVEDVAAALADLSIPGDVVITLGAGSITRASVELASILATRSAS